MKLKKLLKGIPVERIIGTKEVEITGICSNSKLVSPGNLFVAKKGRTSDGAIYIPEAVSCGAVAVLTDIFDPSLKNIVQVVHPDIPHIESLIAAQYNRYPSEELLMIGITGTNGKTTTSYLIKDLFEHTYGECGLIGTIEYIIGKHCYPATHTTPDVTQNQKMLREMVQQGCKAAVMEVTSHALDQGRVREIYFDVAIFTNLTPEHLDYHKNMEQYGAAKTELFRSINPSKKKDFKKAAIVNRDDPYHLTILEACRVNTITYAIDHSADLQACQVQLGLDGTHFLLKYRGDSIPVRTPLIGRFNVYNTLAVIACGLSQKIPLERIIDALKSFSRIPGRLEPVANELGLKIYVDFAHTPDALEKVLICLKELSGGRIITVFGCGGNRDKIKRPMMAKVSEHYSNLSIVTTDNPRSEDPQEIIHEVIEGFKTESSYLVEPDRRKAIRQAIRLAKNGDIILIAGKGHETYQIFAHQTIDFDDRKVAAVAISEECHA